MPALLGHIHFKYTHLSGLSSVRLFILVISEAKWHQKGLEKVCAAPSNLYVCFVRILLITVSFETVAHVLSFGASASATLTIASWN